MSDTATLQTCEKQICKNTATNSKGRTDLALRVRIILFIIALSLGVMTFLIGTQAVLAATLKQSALVTDDVIKLGDIFDNLEENHGYVLGPAPYPGKEIKIGARTLYRIARTTRTPWKPSSNHTSITVKRAATIITPQLIKESIKNAISEKGINSRFEVNFLTDIGQIVLPHDMPENVEIQKLALDPNKNTFEALAVSPSTDNPYKQIKVKGSIEKIISLPVLNRNLNKGDIIRASDIDWIDVPEKSLRRNQIIKIEDMEGMTPKHLITSGKPLTESDLEKPKLVKRGDIITIVFRDSALVLTAKGKALENGAKNEHIRVSNLSSGKTIDALVSNTGEVTVR